MKAVENAGKECEVFKSGEREDRFCKCTGVNDDKWPVLKLAMGNGDDRIKVWVEGKDYLEFDKEYQDCMIRIRGDLGEKLDFVWLLGIPFL